MKARTIALLRVYVKPQHGQYTLHEVNDVVKPDTRRFGGTAFEIGDREMLFRGRQLAALLSLRFTTIIAQPGPSIGSANDEQLRLIAGAASYWQTMTKGGFEVYGSD